MEFGLFTEFHSPPGVTEAAAFDESLAQMKVAEDFGFDTVWLAEIHFQKDRSVLAAPLIVASALAACTQRVKIGIAVQVLPLSHPLRQAEDVATVEGKSPTSACSGPCVSSRSASRRASRRVSPESASAGVGGCGRGREDHAARDFRRRLPGTGPFDPYRTLPPAGAGCTSRSPGVDPQLEVRDSRALRTRVGGVGGAMWGPPRH